MKPLSRPMLIGLGAVGFALVLTIVLFVFAGEDDETSTDVSVRNTLTPSPTTTLIPSQTPTITPSPTSTPTATPTPIPPRVIHTALRQQAWLETIRESAIFPDLYASEDRIGPGTGRDSIRFNAVITITGGIDLDLFTEQDILVDGQTVTLRLPAPQIRDCILDEDKSFYYEENCTLAGVSTGGCTPLKDILRERAFEAVLDTDFSNLLEDAFSEAEDVISELIYNLGGVENVIIEQSTEEFSDFSEDGTCIAHTKD